MNPEIIELAKEAGFKKTTITGAWERFFYLAQAKALEEAKQICINHTFESGCNNYGCEDCGGVAAGYCATDIEKMAAQKRKEAQP